MSGYIGLDIGGTKVLGALYNEAGEVVYRCKKKTKVHEGLDKVMAQIFKVLDEIMAATDETIMGIGAGSPGIIKDGHLVVFAPNLPFENFDLGGIIKERYQVPVVIGNDVNVAMYGEWKVSDMETVNNALGVFPGTGVGGAIIIDKQLYVGQGGAAEIGHMVVNPGGAYCGCGTAGCLEAYASKTGIQKAILGQLKKGRVSVLSEAIKNSGAIIKSSVLKDAYDSGDELAVEILDMAAYYLGIAVANLVNIFHPDLIILGGGMMESMGDELLPGIMKAARSHTLAGMLDDVEFRLSSLSDDAGIYGAYRLIKDQIE